MLKKIVLALAAAASLAGVSSTVSAHERDHDRGRAWGENRFPRHYAPRRVVVVPAPRVVYAPPRVAYPRIAYPYYAAPVVVRPAPVYSAPGFSIRFDIPL